MTIKKDIPKEIQTVGRRTRGEERSVYKDTRSPKAPEGQRIHSLNLFGNERVAKALARAGVCSRRDAERLIEEKRVKVDGQLITTPATLVTSKSRIEVDGKPVQTPDATKVWCYYKPVGYLTTHKDPDGRPTVFDDIKRHGLGRVISVGRLDLNSEGLLLLTNDGEFSRFAELPTTKWPRCYKVRVFGDIRREKLLSLRKGITIEGIRYGPIKVEMNDHQTSLNTWLVMTLHEGKNREIRKVMEHLGLRVNRLIRFSYGPYQLSALKPHEIRQETVRRDEVEWE